MEESKELKTACPIYVYLITNLKPMTRNAAFEAADGNAADGGKKLILIKNECFEAMIEQLDEVADQIEYVAKGNEKLALDPSSHDICLLNHKS